jgi:type IV pilus biogenesis protein CpaD/CtpE
MFRSVLSALSCATLLITAGCAADVQNDAVYSTNAVDVKIAKTTVFYAPAAAELSADEMSKIYGILANIHPSAVKSVNLEHRVAIKQPAHLRKRKEDLGYKRAAAIAEKISLLGVPAPAINFTIVDVQNTAQNEEERLDANFAYSAVVLPDCHSEHVQNQFYDDLMNLPHRALGCTVRSNLGVMVADPSDMLGTKETLHPEAYSSTAPITLFKSGEGISTVLQQQESSSEE